MGDIHQKRIDGGRKDRGGPTDKFSQTQGKQIERFSQFQFGHSDNEVR
jgi:hypothetical protein